MVCLSKLRRTGLTPTARSEQSSVQEEILHLAFLSACRWLKDTTEYFFPKEKSTSAEDKVLRVCFL